MSETKKTESTKLVVLSKGGGGDITGHEWCDLKKNYSDKICL